MRSLAAQLVCAAALAGLWEAASRLKLADPSLLPPFSATSVAKWEPETRALCRSLIDGFIDKDEFKKQIDDWIQVFRKTKPAPGTNGPLIPGDPERDAEAIRSKEGIPLIKPVVDDLLDISRKTGIPFEVK